MRISARWQGESVHGKRGSGSLSYEWKRRGCTVTRNEELAEGERLQRLAAALPPARVRVAQSLPLADLARRLATCSAFIGHDSGISHLAAAVGLAGLVLWGTTVEEVWRPPSDKVIVLRHPHGLARLPVTQVVDHLRRVRLRAV